VHGGKVTAEDKRKLRDKLNGLSLELDRYLAQDYGINPKRRMSSPPGEPAISHFTGSPSSTA
jgi:hypothetical protein